MKTVLTFGEILIRLQSQSSSFFTDNKNTIDMYPGGSEANVAVSLSQFGTTSKFVTAIPDNAIAKEALATIGRYGVDVTDAIIGGDRIGSYYLQSKNGLTKGEVIYDRKYSSFSQLKKEDLNLDKIFDSVHWFHWTALSPGLNLEMASMIKYLLIEAKYRKITISVDLNYRSKLWRYGVKPIEIMPELIQYCDVIMGNIWASNIFLGTPISEDLNRDTPKDIYFKKAKTIATMIFEKYKQCKHIANTFRFMDNDQHNLFYGTYHTRSGNFISETKETHHLIDRIGSGDAFMAGLIHSLLNTHEGQQIIDLSTNAGFEKLFVEGDFGNGNI